MFDNAMCLIDGEMHVDNRGSLRFCNEFDMTPVRRFYTVSNNASNPIRGWMCHRHENKWFFPLQGTTEIVVKVNHDGLDIRHMVLKATTPAVLHVKPGTWFCIKQDGQSEVMVFSDCDVNESTNDIMREQI